MGPEGHFQSKQDKTSPAAKSDDSDLNQLARTTLSGVKPNILPPEPFASGFDLSALAASSRPSRPPPAAARGEDTDGRIDLRALTQSAAPAAAPSKPAPRTLPPARRSGVRELAPVDGVATPRPASAPPFAGQALPPAPAARELDDLIAARSFAPGSQLATHAAQVTALIKRAPAWSWAIVGAVTVAAAFGMAGSGADEAQALAAGASTASAASAASTTSLPLAATALPQIAAAGAGRRVSGAGARAVARRHSAGARGSNAANAAEAADETPAASQVAPAGSAEDRSIDNLLDQAIGGSGNAIGARAAAPAKPARSGPALPQLPARDAVASVMAGLQPRLRFCAGDLEGVATANVIVSNDGRVSSVRISGAPFSRTAAGRCMESVIRGARFPRFEQPTFRMTYPFRP